MNTAHGSSHDGWESELQANERARPQPLRRRRRPPEQARNSASHGFNGKHRRRNKRYSF